MMGYLMDGGWMMLPLLLCSIAMVAVIIDRARAFRAAERALREPEDLFFAAPAKSAKKGDRK